MKWKKFKMRFNILSFLVALVVINQVFCQEYPFSDITQSNDEVQPKEYDFQYSSTVKDPEHRLAYFREEITLSTFHLSFHRAYPDALSVKNTTFSMDRRGDLLYYLHQQIVARYDCERLANGLKRVLPLEDFRLPIKEGYYPVFPPEAVQFNYRGRPANIVCGDIAGVVTIPNMELWLTQILKIIDTGIAYYRNGTSKNLDKPEHIGIFAELVQSTADSINRMLYGNYHSEGHEIIGGCNDPEGNYGNNDDVMISKATAVRDPSFYRWHKHIDNLMVAFISKFPPYTVEELSWNNVLVTNISVEGIETKKLNKLTTYTQKWKTLMNHGIDLQSNVPVMVNLQRMEHENFNFVLEVENNSPNKMAVRATVRLFMAPVVDENGKPFTFDEQRRLFFEVDKFHAPLDFGKTRITRSSRHSSVVASLEKTKKALTEYPAASLVNITEGHGTCGWPSNLLIPRGTTRGMSFVLFAMLTNWNEDKVPGRVYDPSKAKFDPFKGASCYCGSYQGKYPDKRFMGFPFDRKFDPGTTLHSFVSNKPNMKFAKVIIRFSPQVVEIGGTFDPTQ